MEDKITIEKKELPELKEWAKKNNKKIVKTIELENDGLRLIIKDED